MTRDRTTSVREEALLTSFVKSTVSFTSNVTVQSTTAPTEVDIASRVLILLPEKSQTAVKPAFWNADMDEALADATPGVPFPITTTIGGKRVRVSLAVITSVASRTNCPARPDVINGVVAAAMGIGKKSDPLDVVSALPAGFELAITQAVAKSANRSFTAKAGAADREFFAAGVPVRLFLQKVDDAAQLTSVATGVQLTMRLGDAPPSLLDTTTFAEIAEEYAKLLPGVSVDVIRGEELRERGYGGVYGVGKAAEFPPALVTLHYKPKLAEGIAPKDKIALVGKGIVYDTGGLSLKTPSTFMSTMKMDMCGAGAVFSSFVTLVRNNSPFEIVAVLCLADNAVGPRAQRPDDIIIMKSGVSIEVANTDAEGRIVLGDGVFHAAQEIAGFTPSIIVDMATLTGAQLITTGKKHAGVFTNSEEWESRFVAGGKSSGDLCFPLLYCPEFHNPQYDSKVADFKNLCSRSDAVSSTAGMFIANNLPKNYQGAHVHIDLAGPAMGVEVATGYGVALIAQVFA